MIVSSTVRILKTPLNGADVACIGDPIYAFDAYVGFRDGSYEVFPVVGHTLRAAIVDCYEERVTVKTYWRAVGFSSVALGSR